MKVGDAVMFIDTGTYAKWFYGKLAIIEQCTKAADGEIDIAIHHIRVRWMEPVKYFGRFATISDFAAKYLSPPGHQLENFL